MAVTIAILFMSCIAPFSEMQSAATLGSEHIEFTGFYSDVGTHGEHDNIQKHIGVLVGFGIRNRIDMRMRFEGVKVGDDGFDKIVVSAGPKLSLIPNYLSFYIPIGTALDGSKIWQTHPTILFSIPISRYFHINTSAKYLYTLNRSLEDSYAMNLGLALGGNGIWSIRPEYGVLIEPESQNKYQHFSIGIAISPSKFHRND